MPLDILVTFITLVVGFDKINMSKKYTRNKTTPARPQKLVTLCVIAFALLCAAYVLLPRLWASQQQSKPASGNTNNTPSTSLEKSNIEPPKNSTDKSNSNATPDQSLSPDQIPVSQSLSISSIDVKQVGGTVNFQAKVVGVKEAGRCVITFSNSNDRPVVRQVVATQNSDTATCGPLAIPSSEFSFLGVWKAALDYYEDGKRATDQREVTIQ